MGTRSTILITGETQTIRLYKHYDGYPTGNLSLIEKALEKAISALGTYKVKYPEFDKSLSVELITGKIIGESTGVNGMGVELEENFIGPLKPSHFGNHGDLEWVYVIDVEAKTINIYSGSYRGKGKVTDPMERVKSLHKEYQADEIQRTNELIRLIKAWGFKVNPKKGVI